MEVARKPFELAAPVGALAVDEILRRRVDRGDAVQLAQHSILRRPEADAVGDRLVERRVGVGKLDDVPDLEQRRVRVERLADRVDELEPRTEVLVERCARDSGSIRDELDRGGVERPFGEQLAHGALDSLAGRLRAAGLPGGSVRVSRH